MPVQGDTTANDAVDEVRYVLQTTLNSFGLDWERYKGDFNNIGAKLKGRDRKFSVKDIIRENESITFALALKDALEEFIGDSALGKFTSPGNPERFLVLVCRFFSYLDKTADWFDQMFSDFDKVAWPFNNVLTYSEGCRRTLHEAFYSGVRAKIRENYLKQCKELRQRYSYECMDVFKAFYNKLVVPLFNNIEEWEQEDDAAFWWQPFHDNLEQIVRDKMTDSEYDERTFIILAGYCAQAELLMCKYIPDTRERSYFKRMKRKMNDVICKLYWGRRDWSLVGLLSKTGFDKFLFGQLLKLLICSPKQKDMFLMRLRSKIRIHFEFRALQSVEVVPNQHLTLVELKPLLTELEETKTYLLERLEERQDKFPCLAMVKSEILESCREQLELYQIDDALNITDGKLVNRLKEPFAFDSSFQEDAKLIALYIKHLAWDDFMNELEMFAEENISRDHLHVLATLVEFVSTHKSVCSKALCNMLKNAKLIEE